jgi:hypothetical protein
MLAVKDNRSVKSIKYISCDDLALHIWIDQEKQQKLIKKTENCC